MRSITRLAGLLLVAGTLLSPSLSLAEKRGVTVGGKAPADYVAEQTGKSWAVVIGVNHYTDKHAIPELRYAVADAKAVGEELTRRGYQVISLLDEDATRDRILEVLGDELPQKVKPDDRLVIFYAGHGETKSVGGQTMGYLLPVDAKRDRLHKTAVNMGELRQLSGFLPAKHVLFLVDVCYGGIAGQQTRSLPAQTENYLKQITQEKGRQLITAGGPGQQVVEGPQWGHSVFTYYVLEGLTKGLADLNGDGVIPTSELYAYLDGRVPTAAENQQRPELWSLAPEKGEFVFFTSARGAAGGPSRPVPAVAGAPLPKDVDVSGYNDLDAVARLADKREEAWGKVQVFAGKTGVAKEKRVAMLDKFLSDFADDNPHIGEVEALKQQIGAEIQVAKAPAYEAPRQTGREMTGQDGANMLLIPAGEFMMGSMEGNANEKPVHRVALDTFYLDKYEVTNKLFQAFARATGYETTAEKEGKAYAADSSGSWKEVTGANWRKPEGGETVFVSNRDEHPVVSVSWYDAEAYCRWAGKRLPTEAEFEYANRGGTQTTYWWGDGNPGSRRVANIGDESAKRQFSGWPVMAGYDDGYVRTAPVGSFDPNPFGLYDTTGNVWEWTADWYGETYYQNSPSRNPTGAASGQYRVLRGGSWAYPPQYVRSASRFQLFAVGRLDNFGFRCAKTP